MGPQGPRRWPGAAGQRMLTLVPRRLGGPEPGKGRYKGVCIPAILERARISDDSQGALRSKHLEQKAVCSSDGWKLVWNRIWRGGGRGAWMRGGVDGWRRGRDAVLSGGNFLGKREKLSWEIALLPIAQLWPSRFLGCGELSQASPLSMGTLSVLLGFP